MRKKQVKDSGIERLTQRMVRPRFGLGVMHYTALSAKMVAMAFESMPEEFKLKYQLDIPRKAFEITEHGKGSRVEIVGCYWVINER